MTTIRTRLGFGENARTWRFEPTGNVSATNVQKAIEQVDTEAAGKVTQVGTARFPSAAATIAILVTDIEVGVDATSTAVSCTLPSVSAWAGANPNGLELDIFDAKGQSPTHAISFTLNGTDTFLDGTTPQITGAYGHLKLRPALGSPNSWIIRAIN